MNTETKIFISFIVGILLGIAGTGFYIHHCFSRAWMNSGNHNHVVDTLDSRLNLTPDQKAKAEKIFEEANPAMEKIRLETNEKLKAMRDKTSNQINLILTADQQKKFSDLRAEWDKKMNSNDKSWHIPGLPQGPPSGGPGTMCSPSPNQVDTPVAR
jgi:Spy/CpxP family protein refolding chaperone